MKYLDILRDRYNRTFVAVEVSGGLLWRAIFGLFKASTLTVIGARGLSAISGYMILGMSIHQLSLLQFSELALFQTILFLLQMTFDYGLIQSATRALVTSDHPDATITQYQGMRNLIYAGLALVVIAIPFTGALRTNDAMLPWACGLLMFTNTMNMDWILYAQNRMQLWSLKVIATSFANIFFVWVAFRWFLDPSIVILGAAIANIFGGVILYTTGVLRHFSFEFPRRQDVRSTVQMSSVAILSHFSYNLPLVFSTYVHGSVQASSFPVIYRIFSAATLFIPVIVEFLVPRAMERVQREPLLPMTVYRNLLGTCMLLVLPVLVIPNSILSNMIGSLSKTGQYIVLAEQFWVVKICLVLYALDYAAQRLCYIFGRQHLLMRICALGFSMNILITVLIWTLGRHFALYEGLIWFAPLFAFQLSVIILTIYGRNKLVVPE